MSTQRPTLRRCREVGDFVPAAVADVSSLFPVEGDDSTMAMLAPFSAEVSFDDRDGQEPPEAQLWKFRLEGDRWVRVI